MVGLKYVPAHQNECALLFPRQLPQPPDHVDARLGVPLLHIGIQKVAGHAQLPIRCVYKPHASPRARRSPVPRRAYLPGGTSPSISNQSWGKLVRSLGPKPVGPKPEPISKTATSVSNINPLLQRGRR